MAEVAGLALAVVALIGTFKDCIDLFAYISAARSLGRDYEVLDTKLDVEKTLLLQWAERVHLVNPPYDERLDDPTIQATVARILASVRLLLSESKDLQYRYGLERVEDDDKLTDVVDTVEQVKDDNRVAEVASTISGPRMTRFIQQFEELKLRIHDDRKNVSKMRRVCWAIRDKQKFDGLIQELSYFIARLNDITPTTGNSIVSMAEEDLEGLRSLKKLRLVLEASSGHEKIVADLAEQTIVKNCERRILQRIWYRKMDDRRDDVAHPHYRTLEWAFDPSHTEAEWDDLPEWLRSGSGIYWLSGKAGSGKSTLMKYIYGHKMTKTLLLEWADKASLTLTSFFFWNLGTITQKSQDGLSRALLFNVLDSDPSLIPELLPKMWREAYASDEVALSLPSSSEMKQVFETLASSQDTSRKFCFFIDGLDEYSGSYLDGIAFVKRLSTSSNIKVVVSSRPIPACVEAFSSGPKLQLQDLTKKDIASYVYDIIGAHPYMADLLDIYSDEATSILTDLVAKASGVFLWVVLACHSLLEGFVAFDRVSDLRSRVDELPPELENLFQHMLSKIEPRYQSQAAKLLRICHQSHSVHGIETIQSTGLALVDDYGMDVSRISPLRSMSNREKRAKCKLLEGRLRSRCCGLLELKQASARHDTVCFCGLEEHDNLIDSTVEFMHRSVFESLDSPGVWSLDCLQIQDDMFEPNAVLSCLSLHLVRLSLDGRQEQVDDYIKDILLYGVKSDGVGIDSMVPIMSKFEDIMEECEDKCCDSAFLAYIATHHWSLGEPKASKVLLLAAEAGMVNYVRLFQTVNQLILSERPQAFPLLYHAVYRPVLASLSSWDSTISTEMVHWLLQSGYNPNEYFVNETHKENTPWKYWLRQMRCTDVSSALLTAEVTELFIHAGAELSIAKRTVGEALDMRINRLFVNFAMGIMKPVRGREIVREKGNNLLKLIHARQSHSHGYNPTQNDYSAHQTPSPIPNTAASRRGAPGKRFRSTDTSDALNDAKFPRLHKSQANAGLRIRSSDDE